MLAEPPSRTGRKGPPRDAAGRLLFVVNDAQFFVSHRLPLALAASELGLDVHLLALEDDHAAAVRAHGLSFHPLVIDRTGMVPWRDAGLAAQIAGLARRLRPTILHCVTMKPVLYGGLVARALGVPGLVAAVTGLGQMMGGSDLRARLARGLVRPLFRQALAHPNARIVFQNQDDLTEFVAEGWCARTGRP